MDFYFYYGIQNAWHSILKVTDTLGAMPRHVVEEYQQYSSGSGIQLIMNH
ncbi:hypothetical protein ACVXZY_14175 [Staphylococcus aureus]